MSVEAFLRVIDRLPEATLLLSGEGIVLGANRRLAGLGFDPGGLRGRPLSDFTVQPAEAVAAYLRRCSKTSDPSPGALTLKGPGGERAFRADGCLLEPSPDASRSVILLRLVAKEDSAGRFLALNREIEELGRQILGRRRAEDELRERKEWLAVTLSSIGDAVIATDAGGRVTFINPVAQALCGWPGAEALGRALEEVFVIAREGTGLPAEDPVERVLREGRVVGLADHTVLLSRDGARRPIDDSAAPIRDDAGGLRGVVLVFRDVTARREAEELARESEERFRTLADSISQLAWMARPDGHIFWYNRRWYEYTGTTPEQMEGWGWQSVHDPDELPRVLERWRASLQGGQPFEMTFPLRGADGVFRPFLTRVMPTRDREGRVALWCGTNTDIAEQRRLEERLREVDRRKDEFLATLSHELRTPLNAIVGWARILRSGPVDSEDLEEGLAAIERNSRAQARLIEDLLDISRIISGKLRLEVQRLGLIEVIEAAVASVMPAADAKGIRVHTVLDPLADPVMGDAARLQQIVWNLLSNAVKFTPKGGQVRVLLERVNSHVEISVVDTGTGIRPEFLPHVFDRFRQEDGSTTRSHGGLGLGLSIVRQLVEMHGGAVRAKSPGEGRGATFTVTLPVAVVHDDRPERPRPGEAEGPVDYRQGGLLRGLRVLVVDDEPDARRLIGRVLAECEAEVALASSAAQALDLVESFGPDVMVSDIGMPGEDGYDLIRHVRSSRSGKALPAAALTAFVRAEDRMRALRAGFQAHVAKPVDPEELTAVIASLAGRTGGGG